MSTTAVVVSSFFQLKHLCLTPGTIIIKCSILKTEMTNQQFTEWHHIFPISSHKKPDSMIVVSRTRISDRFLSYQLDDDVFRCMLYYQSVLNRLYRRLGGLQHSRKGVSTVLWRLRVTKRACVSIALIPFASHRDSIIWPILYSPRWCDLKHWPPLVACWASLERRRYFHHQSWWFSNV